MSASRFLIAAVAGLALAVPAAVALAGDGGIGTDPPADTASHRFPVPSRHSYGDGFGAGRGHEGQDIFARCGKPLLAARAGRVKYRGFDRAAGNYVAIDGRRTERDYLYAHLKRRAPVRVGERVRTGQRIGRVGDSGNASGCHLHFELWRGDWNGQPDVTRKLKKWDSWS